MKYTVREVIDKLNKLIEENPKIENATFGIYTQSDFYDDQLITAYDLDIEADGYYDANGEGSPDFTIGEHIEDEYDEDEDDENDEEDDDDEYEYGQ